MRSEGSVGWYECRACIEDRAAVGLRRGDQ